MLELPATLFSVAYFNLNLIINDEDDNKFADCAFASNSDYIVTNDKHFDVLKSLSFPKIKVVDIEEFKVILENERLL